MDLHRRTFLGMLLATGAAPGVMAQSGDNLEYFRQAKINWRQAEGQPLALGMNKHPFTESLLPLIPEFKQLTGINIDYLILPENEYFTRLAADLSQKQGEFSVIMTGPMRNWQYVTPGWIDELDPFLKDPKLTDPAWYKLDDFIPGLVSANRWSGKIGAGVGEGPLYSMPVMAEGYILHYRKDIFDQHNIKVPTTIDEMAEAARLVKKHAGIAGIVARGTPNVAALATGYISGLKSYTGGEWSEIDGNMRANLHDPRAVKYTEAYIDMIRESGPSNWANLQWYDAMEAFAAGQAGMLGDADIFAGTFEDPKRSKVAGKVGYALIPGGSGGKTIAGLWTWALGINKAAKNKTAAWLFIQWATSQHTLLRATLNYRNLNPTRTSVTTDPRVKEMIGSWGGGSYVETTKKNFETARIAWVPQPERNRLGDIWARAHHEIYFKRMSATDALKKASVDFDRVLKDAGIRP